MSVMQKVINKISEFRKKYEENYGPKVSSEVIIK